MNHLTVRHLLCSLLAVTFVLTAACSKKSASAVAAKPAKHEHHPPHGGTPVVLGDEVYHIELVREPATGKIQAYVLDGELENFIRSSVPTFQVATTIKGQPQTLLFRGVANPATGETVGDTSLFEAQADWLKDDANFDAELKSITVRGTAFTGIKFNFPKGNDKD